MNKPNAEQNKRIKEAINVIQGLGLSNDELSNVLNAIRGKQVAESFQKKETSSQITSTEVTVPIIIFKTEELSSLEAIVKYLRENLLLTFKQIAKLTNRNEIALSVSYRSSLKKHPAKFPEIASAYNIPVSILKERKKSVLENLVFYLKQNFNLTYHNIAVLLNRNDRTIWTVYQRAIKKNG